MRKVVHIDMDAFFASVEQRDDRSLSGRPVAVGGSGPRAVVAAASYEARAFGVRSAMPMGMASRLCPELVVLRPRFDVYRAVSRQVREVFASYTELVEPLALDEAYLDVTHPKRGPASATLLAQAMKRDILRETGLTSSAGVSTCKFLAKLASGMQKPDGLTVLRPEDAMEVLARLPVESFHGVGPRTAERLRSRGWRYGRDLRAAGREALSKELGKLGGFLFDAANGSDERPVVPDQPRRSLGSETTFEKDVTRRETLTRTLRDLSAEVFAAMTERGLVARRVTVKVRFSDFTTLTRSRTGSSALLTFEDLARAAEELAFADDVPRRPVRLVGVAVSELGPAAAVAAQPRLPF